MAGPLFQALYPQLCQDLGEEPEGSQQHMQQVLERCKCHDAFHLKGPRVALKRWFEWVGAIDWHVGCWHVRLLAILSMGIQMGVWRHTSECPFWGGLASRKRKRAELEEDNLPAPGEGAPSSSSATRAAVAASSAPAPTETEVKEGSHLMKAEDTDLKKIRSACGNSLWTAGAVLCKDGLRNLVAVVQELCRPFYSAHTRNVLQLKSTQGTVEWYCRQAQGQWVETLKEACLICKNPGTLAKMGFDTSYSTLPATATLEDLALVEQDSVAKQAWKLLLQLMCFRAQSMAWHTEGWPGLLALLCSGRPEDDRLCCSLLATDWRAFCQCQELGRSSLFLRNLAKMSPFNTRPLSELVDKLPAQGDTLLPEDLEEVRALSKAIWSGWGQTRLVERGNKEVRAQESFETSKKVLSQAKQWDSLRTRGVISQMGRAELDPSPLAVGSAGKPPALDKQLFHSHSHQPLVDLKSLSKPRTWPSFTPLSSAGLWAGSVLLRHCWEKDTWPTASHCWLSDLLPLGTVVVEEATKSYWVSLGSVGHCAALAWPLAPHQPQGTTLFSLAAGPELHSRVPWLVVLSDLAYKVVPTRPLSPASSFLASGRQLGEHLGLCCQQTGPTEHMLEHAAKNCFWQWSRMQLERLMAYKLLPSVQPWNLFQAILVLIEGILGTLPPAEVDEILSLRAFPSRVVAPEGVDLEGELGDLLDGKDQQEAKDHLEQAKGQEEACKPWRESWLEWRHDKLPTPRPGSSGPPSKGTRPKKLPHNLDLAQWRLCLPPGGFLYESFTDGRVRGYYMGAGGRPSTSAAVQASTSTTSTKHHLHHGIA